MLNQEMDIHYIFYFAKIVINVSSIDKKANPAVISQVCLSNLLLTSSNLLLVVSIKSLICWWLYHLHVPISLLECIVPIIEVEK